MIKIFNKLRIEGNFLNFIKNTNKNPIAYIILNGEKHDTLPLRLRTIEDFPSHQCFQHHTGSLSKCNKKESKDIQIVKKDIKLSLFADK